MHIALYERVWLGFAAAMLLAFIGVVSVSALANGGIMPGHAETVNPDNVVMDDARFSNPRVVEVSPGVYEAYVVARMFSFGPKEIEVPAGAEVTFFITSPDVLHGFEIVGTNINVMVTPGYVTRATTRFPRQGEYLILCNEYCGVAHQMMAARLMVK